MKKKQFILFLTFITLISIIFSFVFIQAKQQEYTYFVYLDPGHGGFDGGATSTDTCTIEKEITLTTCYYLKDYLEKTGIKVKLTRTKDEALAKSKKDDIHKRVKLINDSHCDLYVSIHANAYPASLVKGSQTFYNKSKKENLHLASNIMKQLKMADPTNQRVEKSISEKYLLDHTTKIGCLVELGFLTNPTDLENLKNEKYLQKISFYIYLGIIQYFEESRSYG